MVAVLSALPTMAAAQERAVVSQVFQVVANPDPVRGRSSLQIALNPDNGNLVIVESNPLAFVAVVETVYH